jgi:hypothetical protein
VCVCVFACVCVCVCLCVCVYACVCVWQRGRYFKFHLAHLPLRRLKFSFQLPRNYLNARMLICRRMGGVW